MGAFSSPHLRHYRSWAPPTHPPLAAPYICIGAYQTDEPWKTQAAEEPSKTQAAATTDWYYTSPNLYPDLVPAATAGAQQYAATVLQPTGCLSPTVDGVNISYACNQVFGAAANYQMRVRGEGMGWWGGPGWVGGRDGGGVVPSHLALYGMRQGFRQGASLSTGTAQTVSASTPAGAAGLSACLPACRTPSPVCSCHAPADLWHRCLVPLQITANITCHRGATMSFGLFVQSNQQNGSSTTTTALVWEVEPL